MIVINRDLGQLAPDAGLAPTSSKGSGLLPGITLPCSDIQYSLTNPRTGEKRCVSACPRGYVSVRDTRTASRYCRPVDLGCPTGYKVHVNSSDWSRVCIVIPVATTTAVAPAATQLAPTSVPALVPAPAPVPVPVPVPVPGPSAYPGGTVQAYSKKLNLWRIAVPKALMGPETATHVEQLAPTAAQGVPETTEKEIDRLTGKGWSTTTKIAVGAGVGLALVGGIILVTRR